MANRHASARKRLREQVALENAQPRFVHGHGHGLHSREKLAKGKEKSHWGARTKVGYEA